MGEGTYSEHHPEVSGSIPFGAGVGSLVRIPIPGTGNLAIELRPRGFTPAGGSTSTLFFQDVSGKRHLRLDYGYNKATNSIDYHWNQKGTHNRFGIANHQPAGRGGGVLYKSARYYKYAGRAFLLAGVMTDGYSIVTASKPLQRATEVATGWAGAWVGCKVVGAGGATVGSFGGPKGTAIGGVGGCIIGGIAGYWVGEETGAMVYEWAEETVFTPVPTVPVPAYTPAQ